MDEPLNRPTSRSDGHEEASHAQDLKPDPCLRPPPDICLFYVHLNREENRQGPESQSADQPEEVIEEGKEHRDHRRHNHVRCSPHQTEEAEGVVSEHRKFNHALARHERVIRPPALAKHLYKLKDWLAENLFDFGRFSFAFGQIEILEVSVMEDGVT